MTNLALGAISGLMVAALIFSLVSSQSESCATPYRDDRNIKVGHGIIKAEVAKIEATRKKGLGGRECIGREQGMLFIFDQPGYYPFWMKDMKFPIDMIWLSADKKVVYVQPDVLPSSYPKSFVNPQPAQYVLELQSNRARSLSLKIGSSLQF